MQVLVCLGESPLSPLVQDKVSWAYKKDWEDTKRAARKLPMGVVLEMSPKHEKNFNLVKNREKSMHITRRSKHSKK